MLGWLASLLGGGTIKAVIDGLNRAYEEKKRAANDEQRIDAEKKIASLEAVRDTILAAQRDRVERFVRIGFAFPFIVYNMKLVIWDKVLALGTTDPLSPELANIQMTVIAAYFLHATVSRVMR